MLKQSLMLEKGTSAPDFQLPDPSGRIYSLSDFSDAPALLVAFICNHCPFVHHIAPEFSRFCLEYEPKGLAVVAISSNDVDAEPDDSPEAMARFARQLGFNFPYLYDEDQRTALAYKAICTPDFFLFDDGRRLVYTGQFCSSRPKRDHAPLAGWTSGAVTGADLRAAADAVLEGRPPLDQQRPSAGCSIKWKAGNEPDWN
jgi:peroxiredoxin